MRSLLIVARLRSPRLARWHRFAFGEDLCLGRLTAKSIKISWFFTMRKASLVGLLMVQCRAEDTGLEGIWDAVPGQSKCHGRYILTQLTKFPLCIVLLHNHSLVPQRRDIGEERHSPERTIHTSPVNPTHAWIISPGEGTQAKEL